MIRRAMAAAVALMFRAIACLLPKVNALPRVIKFSQHQFVKRGHAKLLAGGAGANPVKMLAAALSLTFARMVRPALAVAAVLLVTCLVTMGAPDAVFALAITPAASGDPAKVLDELKSAFAQFQQKNDERLAQIEKRGDADGALKNDVEKVNAVITDLQAQMRELEVRANRPALGPDGKPERPEVRAHREAFAKFVRRGTEDGLRELEIKASLSTGTDADGGYAVPEQVDRSILDLIAEISPIRRLASTITVGTSDYKKLVNVHGASSGWVGETAARPATNTPQLAQVAPTMGEIYAFPQATQQSLDDIFFNAEQWLINEGVLEFAQEEGVAFISGNGTNKPTGFLAGTPVATADGARAFGVLQYVATGVAAALSTAPVDELIDMVYAMKAPLRQGAAWVMNSLTTAEFRKVKDANDNYIWQPSNQAGEPATLLGYPVENAEDMPDIAADAFPVAFGNWKRGYLIVDRMGTRTLRDPFTNKPYVGFYMTKRVGGIVQDSEAIKLLKVALA